MNSEPNTITSTSASFAQYKISSESYLKLKGTAIAPVFNTPKYTGSHSRQLYISIATLSPFFIPLPRSILAKRFAFSLNTLHVISLLYGSNLVGCIRAYSFQVILLVSFSSGLSSTKATSSGYNLAFLSRYSITGIVKNPLSSSLHILGSASFCFFTAYFYTSNC